MKKYLALSNNGKYNFVLSPTYQFLDDSEIDMKQCFKKLIQSIPVNTTITFAVCFFGDESLNRHEFATSGNDIDILLKVLKDWDQQESIIEVYDPTNRTINSFVIYPFANEYTNKSIGL